MFVWDKYHTLEMPTLTLAYPDKREAETIRYTSLSADLLFNGLSELTFEINKYEDNALQECYSLIEDFMLVHAENVGWFQITSVSSEGDGLNERKTVTAKSLENEFTTKLLTSFGELGTADDEQGGLDMYWLYKPADKEHSILHIIQEKCPSWTIGYVDPDITQQPRSINEDSISAYSLLVDKASELFECIFHFDTNYQTVNAYKLNNIGKKTNIYLSYNNLINKCSIDCDVDEIKTVLYVTGGNNSLTGSNIDVIAVNPSGSNYICDFTYYKKMMSNELRSALEQYENAYSDKLEPYQNAIDELNNLYDEYYDLQNKIPSSVESNGLENLITQINESAALPSDIDNLINTIDWDLYGSVELQNYYDAFEQRMSLYTGNFKCGDKSVNEQRYQMNHNCLLSVEKKLSIRKTEVADKYSEINAQLENVKSLQIHIEDYINDNLMSELKRFWHEDTYVDDTYIVTSEMTDSEIVDMKCQLLKSAQNKLAKISRPQVQIDISADNFLEIPEFEQFRNELELGNIITLDLDDDIILELRLLKIHFNWTDKTDFKLTFSNKSSLDDTIDMFAEIRQQADTSSSFIGINGVGVRSAKQTVSEFNKYKSSVLNASLQKLQSGDNIEFEINSTGTKWRRWDNNNNDYEPYQMWGTGNGLYLTQDNWNTLSMAIGKMTIDGDILYGVSCDVLMGDFVLTKHLSISNIDSSFNIGENGFIATNGTNTVTINPNDTRLFKILKGDEEVLYLDEEGNGYFAGKLNSKSGNVGGWTIDSSGLYYSNTANNTGIGLWNSGMDGIAIHAGGDNKNISSAPFRVYRDGSIVATKAEIKGQITAISGEIGGWSIGSQGLAKSNGSTGIGLWSTTAHDNIAIHAGAPQSNIGGAPFRVYHTGKVVAQNAYIEGTVNATSGIFKNITVSDGSIWNGNVVQNNYITSILNGKDFQNCTASNGISISNADFNSYPLSNITGDTTTSMYIPTITSSLGYFAIKTGSVTALFSLEKGFQLYGSTNKQRVVKTKNYGSLGLNAYETPVPMFGDCGIGQLNENGECYIDIDCMFAETINLNKEYFVFLTKYGEGDVYVDKAESTQSYFIVKGTPNLKFSWEIKCVQADVDSERWSDSIKIFNDIDYEDAALAYLKDYERSIYNV